ncbi:CAMK protein kinase [Exophiala aquamarina CBS 119918]|uniref:non-specific serine/threonine protein kinase n=1 Tax=Exophiala aquamarina CBS 119918 TaxID=1182545 RepID=A0A072P3R1_9EURO|nr:CAMK protein kinase [Exophiala aquamarina CBS 119918]KEF54322.1 CAMK protein kinase [Exophiala aquamarina CBS 119918]
MDASQPTQQATQQVEDPRKLGKNLSNVSEDDATDVICLLHPNSPAAFDAVRANLILSPQHILQNDDLQDLDEEDLLFNQDFKTPRDIALRMTSDVKHPKDGFRFGRYGTMCDVLLTPAQDDNLISKVHFKIFVNSQGSLMLQDLSTNGTMVDDVHLTTRARGGRATLKPATTVLKNGSIICVIAGLAKEEVKFMVRIPNRGDGEDLYEEKLKKYLSARGAVAKFASMRESSYGNHWNGGSMYNFTGLLGKGAFATVYRIQTKKEGDVYAAKELDKRRFIKNGVLDTRFDSELNIMKTLSHPNIVNYVDCQNYQHWIYILMEYVPYGELSQELRRLSKIPEHDAQQITRQMMHALGYLHRRNITHRDIKPDNILIASRSPLIVKLSDFGLSKCVTDQETFLKTFCGTLLYCAPEVYPDYVTYAQGPSTKRRRLGEPATKPTPSPYDQSVDMWSFGAVIFHMLCGKPPIAGRGDDRGAQMLNNIMTKDVDFDPLRTAGVSGDAIDFIQKLLNRNPSLRPNESQCLKHPWLRDVEDYLEYEDNEPMLEHRERELGVLDEIEEDLLDDDLIAHLHQLTQAPSSAPTPDRPPKRPRRDMRQQPELAREITYPALPNPGASFAPLPPTLPSTAPAERLFGEVTPSVLRSSGVFGEVLRPQAQADLPDIRNRVERISVNDFVTRGDVNNPESADNFGQPLQYPQTLGIPQSFTGSALSLMGAEQQIGQLNMASPGAEVSDDATSEATNPVTPRTRELSPWTGANQTAETRIADNTRDSEEPVFTRRIDLDLVNDPENFAAEIEARNASRAVKIRTKAETFNGNDNGRARPPSIELATTIDAKTGKEIANPDDADRLIHTPVGSSSPHFIKPPKRFGKLTSLPGSLANVAINLENRLTIWGRGIDCTVPYSDRRDTRIPQYAMKINFWAPGMEKFVQQGGDWTQLPGVRTLISTSASKSIWVNDVQLRKETPDGEAALFGQVYTGDVVTIYDSPDGEFLKFKVEITFGDSARLRPEGEHGFVLQQERQHHQRAMKERESMRASRAGSENGDGTTLPL